MKNINYSLKILLTPLFFALTSFSFTAFAGSNFTWTGAGGNSNWSNPANWSGASGYPGQTFLNDNATIGTMANVIFDKTTKDLGNVSIGNGSTLTFGANANANEVTILGNVSFVMGPTINNGYTLLVADLYLGTVSGPGVLSVSGNRTLALQITGSLKLRYANSKLLNSQDPSYNYDVLIDLGFSCDLSMATPASCYIGNPTGKTVQTTMNKREGMKSHARFEGDLVLPNGLKLNNGYDLYLGRNANVTTPNATEGLNDFRFIQTGGNKNGPNGTIKKQFTDVGQEFYFPIGPVDGYMSPITLRAETMPSLSGAIPWPHVSVRCVGIAHPENQQKDKVELYWPVIGYGYSSCISWSGFMRFSQMDRQNITKFDTLYSSRYFANYEDGVFGSGWDLTGSLYATKQSNYNPSLGAFGTWTVYFGPYLNGSVPAMPCWGDFTVGQGNKGSDPIPVELTSFSARYVRDNVQLSWQTATELNNYGFAIERSRDGVNWEEIDFVEGAGNSFSPRSYSYTDLLDPVSRRATKLAYRLRQIDRDGSTEYSSVVFVTLSALPAGVELHAAYPNPFNPSTTISFSLAEAGPVTVNVYDVYGREVVTLLDNAALDAGVHAVAFNASSLPSGSYMVVLNAAGVSRQQRLVLSK